MNVRTSYWAAVVDGIVYGVGQTKREATEDAVYWYGRANSESVPEFDIVPCTKGAFESLYENGWSNRILVTDAGVSLKLELV